MMSTRAFTLALCVAILCGLGLTWGVVQAQASRDGVTRDTHTQQTIAQANSRLRAEVAALTADLKIAKQQLGYASQWLDTTIRRVLEACR